MGTLVLRVVVLAVLLLADHRLAEAQGFEIDLASAATDAGRASVNPGTHVVTFSNLLPGRAYSLSIQHHSLPPEPLPASVIPRGLASATERAMMETCPAVSKAIADLLAATAETHVAALSAAIQTALDQGCADQAIVVRARAILARTTRSMTVTIKEGEEVEIRLWRDATAESQPAAQWTLVLTGPARGQWVTTYGFSFAKNGDERYYAKSVENGQFSIAEEREIDSATLVPSIFFTWQSRKNELKNWSIGPTVGLGVTDASPAVFAGLGIAFNRNIGLVLGGSMLKETRLAGQYTKDQVISEALTPDQLHTKVWRPVLSVSVTLRLDGNPFGGEENEPTPAPAAPPTPAPATTAKPTPVVSGVGNVETNRESAASAFSFSSAGYRLSYTEAGDLEKSSAATRDRLLSAVSGVTDVFIMSHGWWNSAADADCRYRQLADGLRSRIPQDLQPTIKPVIVGIYWPSVIFPTQSGDCAPVVRVPTGAEAMVQGSFRNDLSAWAEAAFPAASRLTSFEADRLRVVELFNKERLGERLTRVETIELMTILDRWRRATPNADATASDGAAEEMFLSDPVSITDEWLGATNRGPAEKFSLAKILDFGNAFTFWTMKTRAGVVGSRGVYDLVKAIRERGGDSVRIHLIGHSFGGRLVAAAVGGRGPASLNQVDSLIMLEGAFSHFAFSTADQIKRFGFPGDKNGAFEPVVASLSTATPAVRGWMAAMFSAGDLPNQVLYPVASRIKGSDREGLKVLRYGSIGASGFQGPPARLLRLDGLTEAAAAAAFSDRATRLVNVDGSNVVMNHSDLIHDQVFDTIWAAVQAASVAPR
ncbi:MAG: hypothetical protein Q8T13_07245 [Acidobacteriota bacterium]|nr:hypothetical protein [Acidobacteriota bacterium]